jgi:hypothetical protein
MAPVKQLDALVVDRIELLWQNCLEKFSRWADGRREEPAATKWRTRHDSNV